MSYDTSGYRERWTVRCVNLFGQPRRIVVTADRAAVVLVMPADTVRLAVDQAHELVRDLRDAAHRARGRRERTE